MHFLPSLPPAAILQPSKAGQHCATATLLACTLQGKPGAAAARPRRLNSGSALWLRPRQERPRPAPTHRAHCSLRASFQCRRQPCWHTGAALTELLLDTELMPPAASTPPAAQGGAWPEDTCKAEEASMQIPPAGATLTAALMQQPASMPLTLRQALPPQPSDTAVAGWPSCGRVTTQCPSSCAHGLRGLAEAEYAQCPSAAALGIASTPLFASRAPARSAAGLGCSLRWAG